MWEWLKDASKKVLETSAVYLQHRAFIQSLFGMQREQAAWVLRQKIEEMDDEAYQMFGGVLVGMINEAQQATQQSSNDAWGTSIEDRLAYSMARIQSGTPDPGNQQAQMYLQGLNEIAYYANLFYQEKQARQYQQQFANNAGIRDMRGDAPQQNTDNVLYAQEASGVDTAEIDALLEKFAQTGEMDPALMQHMSSLTDPDAIERITKKLEEMGANEGASPPLQAKDYYRPSNTEYKLKWPLSSSLTLPLPFDELDEEIQFHVLFSEFIRREMEATQALFGGDTAGAESTFQECLERAKQIDVGELKARSYEGFMRIAQKNGDRTAERKWIAAAKNARQAE
jgi:hypothetical protein